MKTNRITPVIAAIALFLGTNSIGNSHISEIDSNAFAVETASGTCGNDLIWSLDDSGVLTISGTGTMNDYVFGGEWYSYNQDIKELIIEDGVTSIGQSAFYECVNLTSVEIPDSIEKIGNYAFSYCSSLESVEIPVGIKSIGDIPFYDCTSLTSVTIYNPDCEMSDEADGFGDTDVTTI